MNSANIFNIQKKKPLNLLMSFLPKVRKLELAKFSKRLQKDLKIKEVLYEIYSLKTNKQKKTYDLLDFDEETVMREILNSLFEISFLPFFNGIGFTLQGHSKRIIKMLTIPPTEKLENGLASFGMDNIINIWDIQKKELYASFAPFINEDLIISLLLFNEDDGVKNKTYLFVLTWDKLLIKIDLELKSIVNVHQLQQNDKLIDGVIYKGKYLLTSGYDKNIIVWSLKKGDNFKKVGTLRGHTSSVTKLLELNNDRLASGSWDFTIKIWKLDNEENFECEYTIVEMKSKTEDLIQLKDGRLCALGSDGFVKIFSTNYRTIDYVFPGQVFLLQLMDGRVASRVDEEIFQFVNVVSKKVVLVYKTKHTDSISHLQQLTDGRIATSSHDKKIFVHGFTTRKELHEDSADFLYEYNDGCMTIAYKKSK